MSQNREAISCRDALARETGEGAAQPRVRAISRDSGTDLKGKLGHYRQNPKSKIRNPRLARLVPLLLDWFSASARDLPWRRTQDPYAIWVSEIMLQQTQVKTVIPYWERWMRELPTIQSLADASSDKIHKLWDTAVQIRF